MKRKLVFSIVFALFVAGCQPKDQRFVHYHNERFGFELAYPSFMTKDPPPENGDGNLTLDLSYPQGAVDSTVIEHILESFNYNTNTYGH